jgi:hypothetical protein
VEGPRRHRAQLRLPALSAPRRSSPSTPATPTSASTSINISATTCPTPISAAPTSFSPILNQGDSRTDRETARASAYVTLDGKDLFGKGRVAFWFGRHTFTGMYFYNSIETRSRTFGHAYDSPTLDLTTLLANSIDQFRRQVGVAAYVGPSQLATARPSDMRLQPLDIILPRDGDRHMMYYFEPSGTPAQRGVRNTELTVVRYLRNGNIGRREIESSVASLRATGSTATSSPSRASAAMRRTASSA